MDNVLFLIAFVLVVAVVSYLAARAGGAKAVEAKFAAIEADVTVLDRAEAGVHQAFTQQQINVFRQLVFPVFALGLAITPDGDLDAAISRFERIVNKVTDGQPNTPVANG